MDLLIPGLLGPVPIQPEDIPTVPVLSRLLSRGTAIPVDRAGLAESVLAAFGLGPQRTLSGAPPSAPYCHLADAGQGQSGAGYWLHADPVHLRLERDQLLLYDARHLDIGRVEADALVALFNDHFRVDGLRLDAPVPGRWYLCLGEAPRLWTQPLEAVIGRNIAPFLPGGEDGRRWRRIINEAQMLFAQAESNRRREAEGRLPVSGIWPWGGGDLALLPAPVRRGTVFADHPLALGLAGLAGVAAYPLADLGRCLDAALADGQVLVVWDRLWPAVLDADPATWAREVRNLEVWVRALTGLMSAGPLAQWQIDGCQGEIWRLGRLDRWRLWRPIRPLRQQLRNA